MYRVAEEALNWIKRFEFEGFNLTVYICSAPYPALSYGYVVLAHGQDWFATSISSIEGAELLHKDVKIAEQAVLGLCQGP